MVLRKLLPRVRVLGCGSTGHECGTADIRKLGSEVMLVGQNVTPDVADLVFSLPEIPSLWQFLIDIIPAQLAAEYLSHIRGVDCDSFRICSYIVEDEYGLIREPIPRR